LGIPFSIASSPDELKDADKVILPGVGAFDHAIDLLNQSGMRDTLEDLVLRRKVPVLGVCVGMQLLAESSEEGYSAGLGWIKGTVRHFSIDLSSGSRQLPHMGWNGVQPTSKSGLFAGDRDAWRFYFLHSYYFECTNNSDISATTDYQDDFISAVSLGNIYGVQFHPEKSHGAGIQLLRNFGEL